MGLNTLPVKVTTKIPDLNLKGRKLKESFRVFMKKTHDEISTMAKETLKDSIRLTDSVVTSKLLNSVYRRLLVGKSGDQFSSNVGFQKPGSEYAFWANYGRAPNSGDTRSGNGDFGDAISKWMVARGIPAEFKWAIMHTISTEGTKGKHFIEKAEPIIKRNTESILQKRIEEFKRTIN